MGKYFGFTIWRLATMIDKTPISAAGQCCVETPFGFVPFEIIHVTTSTGYFILVFTILYHNKNEGEKEKKI